MLPYGIALLLKMLYTGIFRYFRMKTLLQLGELYRTFFYINVPHETALLITEYSRGPFL